MPDLAAAQPAPTPSLRELVNRHPLIAYFVVAFIGTWLLVIPLVFSQRGLNLISLPDALALALFLLASYTGPFLAALLVTAVTSGKAGVGQLLRRIVQWRVGVRWYLIVFFGYPLLFAVGYLPILGAAPLIAVFEKWSLLLTVYLPTSLASVFLTALGEETGWRGFALPRLQLGYGPLVGSLILGVLHAFWHTPAYFIPGAILPGAFDPTVFVANSLSVVAETLIWTWVFNGARGSILIAILFHALSNGNSSYFPQLVPLAADQSSTLFLADQWSTVILCVGALVVVVATRGRLGYKPTAAPGQSVMDTKNDGG